MHPLVGAILKYNIRIFIFYVQVNCMLTGGLRILGIFVFGPPDVRTKLKPKFRQTLYAVHKMICSELPLARWKLDQTMCNSQVMVQVCSATKKYPCIEL